MVYLFTETRPNVFQARESKTDAELQAQVQEYRQQINDMKEYYNSEMQRLRNEKTETTNSIDQMKQDVPIPEEQPAIQQKPVESPLMLLQQEFTSMRQEWRESEQRQLDQLKILTGDKERGMY